MEVLVTFVENGQQKTELHLILLEEDTSKALQKAIDYCLYEDGIRLDRKIIKAELMEAKGRIKKFYYTFGSDELFPYQNGWVIVFAREWEEAHKIFRSHFPDRTENCLNCASYYDEKQWSQIPEKTWHGYKCYELIFEEKHNG